MSSSSDDESELPDLIFQDKKIPENVLAWGRGIRRPETFPDAYDTRISRSDIYLINGESESEPGDRRGIYVVARSCSRCVQLKQSCNRHVGSCARCNGKHVCEPADQGWDHLPGPYKQRTRKRGQKQAVLSASQAKKRRLLSGVERTAVRNIVPGQSSASAPARLARRIAPCAILRSHTRRVSRSPSPPFKLGPPVPGFCIISSVTHWARSSGLGQDIMQPVNIRREVDTAVEKSLEVVMDRVNQLEEGIRRARGANGAQIPTGEASNLSSQETSSAFKELLNQIEEEKSARKRAEKSCMELQIILAEKEQLNDDDTSVRGVDWFQRYVDERGLRSGAEDILLETETKCAGLTSDLSQKEALLEQVMTERTQLENELLLARQKNSELENKQKKFDELGKNIVNLASQF